MQTNSACEVKKVTQVQFGILSPEQILKMSVCPIEFHETYDPEKPKHPKVGGLLDPRMGTIDRDIRCMTCSGNMADCPGHFGHIGLIKPVYNIGFLSTVLKILRCVCFNCGMLLVDPDNVKFKTIQQIKNPRRRLQAMVELCKGKMECQISVDPNGGGGGGGGTTNEIDPETGLPRARTVRSRCGWPQPNLSKDGLRIVAEFKQQALVESIERKQFVYAEKALQILNKISDDDIRFLGFDPQYARPAWMIITNFPVPPPAVRPSVRNSASQRSEDDLTYKLAEIVKFNTHLRRHVQNGAPAHVIDEFQDILQYHAATFENNEVAGLAQAKQKGGRPLKSVRQRLRGKEGRVRGNLMGKRVDFSARTVITPDPNLMIDQVGVPRTIALNLTFPEIVTPFNIERMYELVRRGPREHPGAKYIIREDGTRLDLRFAKRTSADLHLEYGYKVERHIQDDDIVLFNRQPSLHKMSMMGHRVKVMPYSTFRLNLSVTTPYNADFDGDEMNLHVPQSLLTKAELLELMMVPLNIVSPQGNKPVMGVVQDSLLGSRKLTRRDTFIEKDLMMNMIMVIDDWDGKIPTPAILKPRALWTGKQLFSQILPDVNLVRYSTTHSDTDKNDQDEDISNGDTKVIIENGQIFCGILDSNTLGRSGGSLIHVIWLDKGPNAAKQFLSQCQRLVNHWLLQDGFSIGIADTIADGATMNHITDTLNEANRAVKELILKAQKGDFTSQPGATLEGSFEDTVNKALNKAADESGSKAKSSLKDSNNIKMMVTAGSKGSYLNISQIMACVGQQNVEGKRIPFGFRRRTLPHYSQDDYTPESRGFVQNSYVTGLTPHEFFFHTMGGREGLIDTAVKTSETGYVQRRLIKALEDVSVKYDGTIRDSSGNVLQFLYGEDGMDGSRLEMQRFYLIETSDRDLRNQYAWEVDDHGNMHADFGADCLEQEVINSLREHPIKLQLLVNEFRKLQEDRRWLRAQPYVVKGQVNVPLPVNLNRLITNAQKQFGIDVSKRSNLNPADVIEKIQELSQGLVVIPGDDPFSREGQENATLLLNIFIRSRLASKLVCRKYRLDDKSFNWILGEIKRIFKHSFVQPGEMVGTVAAQSVGEPATQMTLNTFHFAGISSKNVTLGVPRLKELMNIAKNIKTPSLTIFLKREYCHDSEQAKDVQAQLEYTTLKDVALQSEIYYDPDPHTTVIQEDEQLVSDYYGLYGENVPFNRLSPWLLRIELDRRAMLDKKLLMANVADRILQDFSSDLHTVYSDDNAEKLILRIRIVNEKPEEGKDDGTTDLADDGTVDFLKQIEQNVLYKMCLCGVTNIQNVFVREFKTSGWDSNGVLKTESELILETNGINLLSVLSFEKVDQTRTISNDIVETFNVLGIEAVRASLLREFRFVMDHYGLYINYRHLAVLIDKMTSSGHLMAITRHGINRSDSSPLTRCSFEETVEILMEAAQFSEKDDLKGVSSNIMHGSLAPIGTGSFDLFLNEEMLKKAVEIHLTSAARSGLDGGDISSAVYSPYGTSPYSPAGSASPGMGTPFHVGGDVESPFSAYSPSSTPYTSDLVFSPTMASPGMSTPGQLEFSASPYRAAYASPYTGSPASPQYSPTSPAYSASPSYSPTSPAYNASPEYSPSSPAHTYSPTSPVYSPASPSYSPTSPAYSPTSPAHAAATFRSPSSPAYSPTSPAYSPASPAYSPTSPAYSPTSPARTAGAHLSPASPAYSPTSPAYSPTSPSYSPSSPAYSPTSPQTSPAYSPSSPQYSPTSPRR